MSRKPAPLRYPLTIGDYSSGVPFASLVEAAQVAAQSRPTAGS